MVLISISGHGTGHYPSVRLLYPISGLGTGRYPRVHSLLLIFGGLDYVSWRGFRTWLRRRHITEPASFFSSQPWKPLGATHETGSARTPKGSDGQRRVGAPAPFSSLFSFPLNWVPSSSENLAVLIVAQLYFSSRSRIPNWFRCKLFSLVVPERFQAVCSPWIVVFFGFANSYFRSTCCVRWHSDFK